MVRMLWQRETNLKEDVVLAVKCYRARYGDGQLLVAVPAGQGGGIEPPPGCQLVEEPFITPGTIQIGRQGVK